MSDSRHRLFRARMRIAGFAAVVGFAVLAGRFWHPYYGFTKFVQLDELDARNGIHEIRENAVFVYPGENGYDGAAYAQIAFHPLLDSAELKPALGNVPYRARRILGSALAWLFAGGAPVRIAHVYAALNLGVWLALAGLLWRALPVSDLRSVVAWIGVMFSAGALHSVRLALTDLLGATLVAAALWLSERGRHGGALGAMASAGLARETALANIVALWRGPWKSRRAWAGNLMRTALVALPLFLWIVYVHWKAGPAAQGFGNFSWPIAGWVEKAAATVTEFSRSPNFRWLNTTTLLAFIALTVQAVFLLRRARWKDAWWRAGACGAVMMLLLGTSVWEGHPGAATRVLLPMSVAFAVVAIREQASWSWILGGSLSVFSGVLALWNVPQDAREIAAGRFSEGAFVARLESGWFGAERDRGAVWSWSAGRAELTIETAPRVSGSTKVRLKLRGIDTRVVEISQRDVIVWRGQVGERLTWIEFSADASAGRIPLTVQSAAAPRRENENPDARSLNFAVYGVQLR